MDAPEFPIAAASRRKQTHPDTPARQSPQTAAPRLAGTPPPTPGTFPGSSPTARPTPRYRHAANGRVTASDDHRVPTTTLAPAQSRSLQPTRALWAGPGRCPRRWRAKPATRPGLLALRSEEHTSELQSRGHL